MASVEAAFSFKDFMVLLAIVFIYWLVLQFLVLTMVIFDSINFFRTFSVVSVYSGISASSFHFIEGTHTKVYHYTSL